ncbi:MAG: co-chaperone GroES [Candidatus Moranbacteria bacterium RIFOXYB1_FULL_43_19]|nr:MAG: co-chaperone GroES [Candidatus Moranbacteria bacterium RIFOXYB1_FULL_43_19]OGI33988.1 MAG: co-chaperone GroES [Candidatus Moranbacteria bacterium RIFOXYC1_FULL_44_13]OGI37701.1 MAG: co-chaperone GroES [Candidatus Moranbacteria bacterium RIFOXYD1_FULL_44_12]
MAKKSNIEPLGENVLIEPAKADQKTASGIVLPDTSEEKPQEGLVVAVGTDKKIRVKPGQKVIYSKYSGNEIKVGETEYLLVKNEDILAVVK